MPTRTHSFAIFMLVGFAGAFVTALAFIAVLLFTLPPTDGAYGQGIVTTLRNPFVLTIAAVGALMSGALAAPLLYFSLRRRRLGIALPIVFASVLIAVAVTTPLSPYVGLFCAFVALVVSCIVCARIALTRYDAT